MRFGRLLLLSLLLLAAIVSFADADAQRPQKPSRQIRKMVKYLRTLERHYVEDIDLTPYIEGSIGEITSQLDPFSRYMTAEQYEQFQSRFTRRIAGIGAEFVVSRDSVVVLRVMADSPAQTAGLKALDRIVAIDSHSVVGSDSEAVIAAIQGEPSSSLTLSVFRPSDGSVYDFSLRRAVIPQRSIPVYYKVSDDVAYVKLSSFTYDTSKSFEAILQTLGDVQTLILDLCDNSGGLVAPAIDVAGCFLKKNSVVCGLRNNGRSRQYRSAGNIFDGRVVLMVNEMTASASEVVAAALQDWDRAVVVGRATFGKGVGQHTFRYEDGSALQLTTMQVVAPSGRMIQRPFELGATGDFYADFFSRMNEGVISEIDTAALPEFLTLRSSRRVYGNSGIQPDVVVARHREPRYDASYNPLVVAMLDKYRQVILSAYPLCSDFITNFAFDDSDLRLFAESGNAVDVELLKMRMAFNIYPAEQYYPLYNEHFNDIYREALSVAFSPIKADEILSGGN